MKKTLLILVCVLGLLLTVVLVFWQRWVEPYRRQARAVDTLHEAGFIPGTAWIVDHESIRPRWLQKFLSVSSGNVAHLLLQDPGDPAQLPKLRLLKRFPRLKNLVVTGLPVDETTLDTIARMRELQVLRLTDTDLDDVDLRKLKVLHGLRSLELSGNPRLSGSAIADLIDALPNLEDFLNETGSVDATLMQAIARHPRIHAVFFRDANIDDNLLRILDEKHNPMIFLDLQDNPGITDAGLKHLESPGSMQTLISIRLSGTAVTQTGVDSFKKAVPNCSIDWNTVESVDE